MCVCVFFGGGSNFDNFAYGPPNRAGSPFTSRKTSDLTRWFPRKVRTDGFVKQNLGPCKVGLYREPKGGFLQTQHIHMDVSQNTDLSR